MKLTEIVRPFVLLSRITTLTGGAAGALDGIPTVDLAAGVAGMVVVADEVYFFQLQASDDAESDPDVIRPDDFATTTNEKVWRRLDLYTA